MFTLILYITVCYIVFPIYIVKDFIREYPLFGESTKTMGLVKCVSLCVFAPLYIALIIIATIFSGLYVIIKDINKKL